MGSILSVHFKSKQLLVGYCHRLWSTIALVYLAHSTCKESIQVPASMFSKDPGYEAGEQACSVWLKKVWGWEWNKLAHTGIPLMDLYSSKNGGFSFFNPTRISVFIPSTDTINNSDNSKDTGIHIFQNQEGRQNPENSWHFMSGGGVGRRTWLSKCLCKTQDVGVGLKGVRDLWSLRRKSSVSA